MVGVRQTDTKDDGPQAESDGMMISQQVPSSASDEDPGRRTKGSSWAEVPWQL